ncbi:MAG: DUF4159 domain-containing protein [Verrucomicrobia bacterium]|nr:DUF4159 domain-containing protein [Verrucomicrobiota bacterium]
MKATRTLVLLGVVALSSAVFCSAQRWWHASRDGMIRTEGGEWVNENTVQTAREIAEHSTETPNWTNTPGFGKDVFTFVRIIRDRNPYDSPTAGSWITDFPDSDLNLSYRIQQMTSIRVNPDGRTIRLTNPDLFNYPFIYMVEPGALILRDAEVPILRKYLLNGGVLMADDFWGEWQWKGFAREIKRVLPEREFVELPMDHPIFHCVFDLNVPKNKLQTPNIRQGIRSQYDGVTWESHPREGQAGGYGYGWRGRAGWEECTNMHVRAILDDHGRIMVIATHNCDNGDGWEREGENDYFFHEFSEKRAFPLGINIVFYLMTH